MNPILLFVALIVIGCTCAGVRDHLFTRWMMTYEPPEKRRKYRKSWDRWSWVLLMSCFIFILAGLCVVWVSSMHAGAVNNALYQLKATENRSRELCYESLMRPDKKTELEKERKK